MAAAFGKDDGQKLCRQAATDQRSLNQVLVGAAAEQHLLEGFAADGVLRVELEAALHARVVFDRYFRHFEARQPLGLPTLVALASAHDARGVAAEKLASLGYRRALRGRCTAALVTQDACVDAGLFFE